MGMLQQGTLGETEKEIGATLFQGLKKEDVAQQFRQLKQVNKVGIWQLKQVSKVGIWQLKQVITVGI